MKDPRGILNQKMIRFLIGSASGLLAAAFSLNAQPGSTPIVNSANNSADYSTTLAQGSLFVVFGQNLGPTNFVQVSAFPLPNILSGTSITVTSGSTTLNC